MRYESPEPIEFDVPPRDIESMVVGDLSFITDPGLEFSQHLVPAELLRASATVAVELMDCGGASEVDVAEMLREDHPELAGQYPESTLREIAWLILHAELPGLSKHFQALFDEFNDRYFCGKLPPYQVRLVFDLHRAAKEPVFGGHVSSGLILFENAASIFGTRIARTWKRR